MLFHVEYHGRDMVLEAPGEGLQGSCDQSY